MVEKRWENLGEKGKRNPLISLNDEQRDEHKIHDLSDQIETKHLQDRSRTKKLQKTSKVLFFPWRIVIQFTCLRPRARLKIISSLFSIFFLLLVDVVKTVQWHVLKFICSSCSTSRQYSKSSDGILKLEIFREFILFVCLCCCCLPIVLSDCSSSSGHFGYDSVIIPSIHLFIPPRNN